MGYKLYIYRDRKLFTTKETNNRHLALKLWNKWTNPIDYNIHHTWQILLYYKNKRIKTYNSESSN